MSYSFRVRVTHAETGRPASGVSVTAFFAGSDLPGDLKEIYTDGDGWASVAMADTECVLESLGISYNRVAEAVTVHDGEVLTYTV